MIVFSGKKRGGIASLRQASEVDNSVVPSMVISLLSSVDLYIQKNRQLDGGPDPNGGPHGKSRTISPIYIYIYIYSGYLWVIIVGPLVMTSWPALLRETNQWFS